MLCCNYGFIKKILNRDYSELSDCVHLSCLCYPAYWYLIKSLCFSGIRTRAYDSLRALLSHSQPLANTTRNNKNGKHRRHLVEEDYDSMSMSSLSSEVGLRSISVCMVSGVWCYTVGPCVMLVCGVTR